MAQSIEHRGAEACQTLPEIQAWAAGNHASTEAYVELDTQGASRQAVSFSGLHESSLALAAWMELRGIGPGSVLALVAAPSIAYATAYAAAARLGAVTSGINPRLGERERREILEMLEPELLLADDPGTYPAAIDLREALSASMALTEPTLPMPIDGEAPVTIVWTSGTTGKPKGAVFTHRALRAVARGVDVLSQPGDRRLSPVPFAHVAYMTRVWDEAEHGITTVISPQPWRASTTIAVMEREGVTVGQGVPTQWELILADPKLETADLSALRLAGTGAARMAPDRVAALRNRLGVPVIVRYTSTETSLGTGTRPGDADDIVATTVGQPVPGVQLSLLDDEAKPVAVGEVGRVVLRSDATMLAYLAGRDPSSPHGLRMDEERTREVRRDDGSIITGDFGMLDAAGNLSLVGRANELYQRGGYNVYPAEVEVVISALDGVKQVAVVGAADPILGEVGVAVLALEAGKEIALEDLREAVKAVLADYKAPDALLILDELPLTPMMKIDRTSLQAPCEEAARVRSR